MSITRISRFHIYMAIIGSCGVILSFLVPIMKYSVSDDIYVDPYYDPVWLGGLLLALIPGVIILLTKRTDFRTAGILFLIVGVGSLLLFLAANFK